MSISPPAYTTYRRSSTSLIIATLSRRKRKLASPVSSPAIPALRSLRASPARRSAPAGRIGRRGIGRPTVEEPDYGQCGLLRTDGERPGDCATKSRDELPPSHHEPIPRRARRANISARENYHTGQGPDLRGPRQPGCLLLARSRRIVQCSIPSAIE